MWGPLVFASLVILKLIRIEEMVMNLPMARQLRFEYPGAVYHVMARGDGGKRVFIDDKDARGFLFRLGRVCQKNGWRVYAWVLMPQPQRTHAGSASYGNRLTS